MIPGSRLEIFEQSEHFPHMDEPSRFARVMLDFLATTEPMHLDRATMRERMAQRTREHHEAGERAEAERLAREAAELEIADEAFGGLDSSVDGGSEYDPLSC